MNGDLDRVLLKKIRNKKTNSASKYSKAHKLCNSFTSKVEIIRDVVCDNEDVRNWE